MDLGLRGCRDSGDNIRISFGIGQGSVLQSLAFIISKTRFSCSPKCINLQIQNQMAIKFALQSVA